MERASHHGPRSALPRVRQQGWEQWEQCGRLLPHVLTVATNTAPETHSLELAAVLTRAADYLVLRAQYDQAEPLSSTPSP